MYKKLTFLDWIRSLLKPSKSFYSSNKYKSKTALYRKHTCLAQTPPGNFFRLLKGKTVIVKF